MRETAGNNRFETSTLSPGAKNLLEFIKIHFNNTPFTITDLNTRLSGQKKKDLIANLMPNFSELLNTNLKMSEKEEDPKNPRRTIMQYEIISK